MAKIMNSDCSVQETLQNLKTKKERLFGTGDIENITLENGKCYENIKELCSDSYESEKELFMDMHFVNECSDYRKLPIIMPNREEVCSKCGTESR
ncbi:MAG: hypothetical protein ACLUTU_06600 [Blautia faecis]